LSPRTRLWLVAGALLLALLVLGVVLQSINSLIWQLSYWLPPWLVGPVVLLLFGAALALLAQLGWPWLKAWRWGRLGRRPAAGESTPPLPAGNRQAAAERQLAAIEQTLTAVRDAVEREALRQEHARVQAELQRGDLVIVLFGSGSTGKTSLIRALLQQLVGEVGAAMGSTRESCSFRLRLRGLERGVRLVDTPGILEAGSDGRSREALARRQAARADLLLLVVDGDLRAAEMEVFEALAGLGKRLLLVLNKSDLRGESEVRRLLQLLRNRCGSRLAAEDVIAASAAPQSVPMPGGRPLQPKPEVEALLRRIATVLHQDGEDLIADNILLQSRQLGEESRRLLAAQRRRDADAVVERYSWIGAGVLAATPLPGVDLLATAAVNAQMVIELGRLHGVSLSRASAQDLAVSVGRTLAGLGVVKGGVALLTTALSLQLPTVLLSRALQAVVGAWLTRIAGQSFITYFEREQCWGDGGMQEVVRQQYDLNRRDAVLQRFLAAAFSRVVEPLQRGPERRLPPRPGPPVAEVEADRPDRAP
jgi:small GTP-binding protein